jgi:hypothetical protein
MLRMDRVGSNFQIHDLTYQSLLWKEEVPFELKLISTPKRIPKHMIGIHIRRFFYLQQVKPKT